MCDIEQERSVPIHPKRIRFFKENWQNIYTPIVEYGKLQVRFNVRAKSVDLRTCEHTKDVVYINRSELFIKALESGFKVEDSLAIMRFPDVYLDSFNITEVRKLKNSHFSRAVGRIIGRNGKIKESIENFSKCRFLLSDQKVTLLGCPENIKIARDAIGRLIQGSEPTSVFNRLRVISNKLKDKYGFIESIPDIK